MGAIRKVVGEDPEIKILVLAAAAGGRGPGPLVSPSSNRASASGRKLPVTIVPGDLTDDEIEELGVADATLVLAGSRSSTAWSRLGGPSPSSSGSVSEIVTLIRTPCDVRRIPRGVSASGLRKLGRRAHLSLAMFIQTETTPNPERR